MAYLSMQISRDCALSEAHQVNRDYPNELTRLTAVPGFLLPASKLP